MIVVLSEESFRDLTSVNGRELKLVTETARLLGCRVVPLPTPDFVGGPSDDALAYLPSFDSIVPAVWVGYIPPPDWYTAVYDSARGKGVHLVNSPAEHQIATEFGLAFPLLGSLTHLSATHVHGLLG